MVELLNSLGERHVGEHEGFAGEVCNSRAEDRMLQMTRSTMIRGRRLRGERTTNGQKQTEKVSKLGSGTELTADPVGPEAEVEARLGGEAC